MPANGAAGTIHDMRDRLRLPFGYTMPGDRPWRAVLLLGLLATLLFTQLLSQQSVVADDDYLLIEARIVAERQADGSVAAWLEVRRSDDGWAEWLSPQDRVLPADAELDLWHDTSSFSARRRDRPATPQSAPHRPRPRGTRPATRHRTGGRRRRRDGLNGCPRG